MVDVKNKKCIHYDCKAQPNYNVEGETISLYCATHKKTGMVNVISKTCIHPDCRVIPNYNIICESNALYCVTHKKEGMIDVKNKTCIHPDCRVIPVFNLESETQALYCDTHKKEGMVNIKDKTCIHPDCRVIPVFNLESETQALYCDTHKKEGMVNIKDKTCKNDWCLTQVKQKYDGYCLRCFINMFPDKPVAKNYKTKEFAVVEFVKLWFPNFTWLADKQIKDGCSFKRPDLLLDLGYQIIIVEVDENQHNKYDCSCENKRLMELSQDLGHRPIIFIRFNPDDYININNERVRSCWSITKKTGIVKIEYKKEWNIRLECLKEQINYWTQPENKTDKTLEIIQLFYNQNI